MKKLKYCPMCGGRSVSDDSTSVMCENGHMYSGADQVDCPEEGKQVIITLSMQRKAVTCRNCLRNNPVGKFCQAFGRWVGDNEKEDSDMASECNCFIPKKIDCSLVNRVGDDSSTWYEKDSMG